MRGTLRTRLWHGRGASASSLPGRVLLFLLQPRGAVSLCRQRRGPGRCNRPASLAAQEPGAGLMAHGQGSTYTTHSPYMLSPEGQGPS